MPFLCCLIDPLDPPVAYGPYRRPAFVPARYGMVGVPAGPVMGWGGQPAIEPGYGFFAGGHAIGGPTGTSYRGVSAGSFPLPAVYVGSGGPLESEMLHFAGAPVGGGAPWTLGHPIH